MQLLLQASRVGESALREAAVEQLGRFVSIIKLHVRRHLPALLTLARDNLRASGFYWGFHLGIGRVNGDEEVRARTRVLIDDITSAVADGTLRPHISERYPLARGAEALLAVRERRVSGRVTLNMDEGNNNP